MKTIVYIDGYNLYYGRLSQTPHKWLDVVALCSSIVTMQDPSSEIIATKYFTAPALAKFARRGQDSAIAQQTYHRALEHTHGQGIEIVLGAHQCSTVNLPIYVADKNPSKDERTWVWQIIEKKTDVNLAIHMYRDAVHRKCDQMVLCSNDSDAEPALKAIRDEFPDIRIGVIAPIRPVQPGEEERRPSADLSTQAHWTRRVIQDDELTAAQLPALIPTRKKPIRKPPHW